jgi:methionine-rich copper-binding protein CopC
MKFWGRLAVLVTFALYALAAGAHAKVIESTPPADAVITVAPKEIVLVFKSPTRLTALSIESAGQAKQSLGPIPTENVARIAVAAPSLKPGEYTVTWNAVGQDGHMGSGTIKFTLKAN